MLICREKFSAPPSALSYLRSTQRSSFSQTLLHSFIVSKRCALCHEKTGKADLGVYQEICCLNKTQRFKHSCLQSQQSSPLQDPFPTPLLRTRLQPPPISLITTTPPRPPPLLRLPTDLKPLRPFMKRSWFWSRLGLNKHFVHLDQRTSSREAFCL